MGVTYKLKPEVGNFILEEKKKNPGLGCRALAALAEAQFKVKISKSSVNAVIKGAGLSMPVGRRRKPRRGMQEAAGLGAMILKAADCLVGGTQRIVEIIRSKLPACPEDVFAKTEYLLYAPLFDLSTDAKEFECGLWPLINHRIHRDQVTQYSNDLDSIPGLVSEIRQALSTGFAQVRAFKLQASDGTSFYIDAQLHTVWATGHIPHQFSLPAHHAISRIRSIFLGDASLVLLMAPGYDAPTKDFFNLLFSLDASDNPAVSVTVCDSRLTETEVIPLEKKSQRTLVFGLWPWQFQECRRIHVKPDFRSFKFEPLNRDFYLAEAEVELFKNSQNRTIKLKGCAVKTDIDGELRLFVLTNQEVEKISLDNLLNAYFGHFSSLEEAFQDYSRKVEFFNNTLDNSESHFSINKFNQGSGDNISLTLENYRKMLDSYVRRQLLPPGNEQIDFSAKSEQFYSLKAIIKRQKGCTLVVFEPPAEYPFLKDLEYLCRRLNELEIFSEHFKRLWFTAP